MVDPTQQRSSGMAKQKISLSRWNIGEVSPRSIGDFDQPAFPSSCRYVNNFVISESGKMWRRPGFTHHVSVTPSATRLIPLYLRDDTFILMFWLDGAHPTQVLKFTWYRLVADVFTEQTTISLYTFKAADFGSDRPNSVDLRRLSYVQVEAGNQQFMYLTHPNMEDPREVGFTVDTSTFFDPNGGVGDAYKFTDANNPSYYWDVYYGASQWEKTPRLDLDAGGGNAIGGGVAGWTPYTGKTFLTPRADNYATPQIFKYLTAVTFSFQRLVWARNSWYAGSVTNDISGIGFQYQNQAVASTIDPYQVLASDPFLYQVSSDLGYEDIQWLAAGSLLLGGANNGAWVLSNAQAGGLDATNPLAYKSSSNGCHWVPGKTVGDAMLFFQRPGRQLNEFLFANASQNYVSTNLSEFSDHLFYDKIPVEMQIQRSPFNVAWILREDGVLVSFTYDRVRQIYAWARHDFTRSVGLDSPEDNGKVNSLCIYSDGVTDRPVVHTTRTNADGEYHAIEMMDFYTPNQIDGVFVDSASREKLLGPTDVLSITQDDVNGHWIFYDDTDVSLADGFILNFIDAERTEDDVSLVTDNKYDYIYGEWEVFDHDAGDAKFRMKDLTGEPYIGIYDVSPVTTYAYTNLGKARQVTNSPLVASRPKYAHLKGIYCRALLDGSPQYIRVSNDGTTFYNADTIAEDWDGVTEAELDEITNYWNSIIIGRSYQSLFSPFILKKQVNKGKITKMEIEVFRSLGGKVGTGTLNLTNELENEKIVDLIYPAEFEENSLYTGTLKPQIVGGYDDDPLWFLLVEDAVPFNLTNVIYYAEVN